MTVWSMLVLAILTLNVAALGWNIGGGDWDLVIVSLVGVLASGWTFFSMQKEK